MTRLVRGLIRSSVSTFLVIGGAAQALGTAAPAGDTTGARARNVDEWNVGKDRLAIQGYDPVAYFPEEGGVATKGDERFTLRVGGSVYRFSSAAHLEKFRADPSRYQPSHGGWCSYAMLEGDKVQVDPKSFIVKDGRLFLFYKGLLGDTRAKWLKADQATETKTADAMWKKITGESAPTSSAPKSAR